MSYGPMTEEEFHVTVIITRELMKYHIELPEEVCYLIGLIVVQAEREYERLRQMYLRRNRRMYRRSARWYEAHMGALRAAHEGLGDRWYRNSLHPNSRLLLQLEMEEPIPVPRREDCVGPDSDSVDSEVSTPPSPVYSDSSE